MLSVLQTVFGQMSIYQVQRGIKANRNLPIMAIVNRIIDGCKKT
jgi:hypothetical protein